MKLITFQSIEALKELTNKGYLECNEKFIDLEKRKEIYSWVIEQMNNKIVNKNDTKYPLWCWVKCYNSICPPKHKGKPVEGFDCKITFEKTKDEVFVTDYIRYSFILNNLYIPDSLHDKEEFDKRLEKLNITKEELKAFMRPDKYGEYRKDKEYLEVCKEIRKNFTKVITNDSDILQGCVWRIDLNEVSKIEILTNDKEHVYGSLNYERSNGKRINWQNLFYKKLK